MDLGHMHVLGPQASDLVCLQRSQVADVLIRLFDAAQGEAADHAGGDLHATLGIGPDPLQAGLSADDRGGGAVGHGCAHRQGDRVGDRRRR
ncbi:hypothetical protein D3C80_1652800 [compost metagenome]